MTAFITIHPLYIALNRYMKNSPLALAKSLYFDYI